MALTAGPAGAAVVVDARQSLVDAYAIVQSSFGGAPVEDEGTASATHTGSFSQRRTANALISSATADVDAGQSSNLAFTDGSFSGATASGDSFSAVVASDGDFAQAEGTSEFLVRFTVPAGESYDYSFSGSVADDGPRASSLVDLSRVVGQDLDVIYSPPSDNGPFATSGVLPAGQYEVYGIAFTLASDVSQGGGNAAYGINFSLTPVPEPASMGLLGVAGAGLLARRRRA